MSIAIVSEVTLYTLRQEDHGNSHRAPGTPILTVTTYAPGSGVLPTFHGWRDDGVTLSSECNLAPNEVVGAVRAMRRTAQDDPTRYVCLNRTNGDLRLVA